MSFSATEPIAIIGMGCRFPQADGPDAFWQLLRAGKQAITSVPAERWPVDDFYDPNPGTAGRMSSHKGGFLSGVDEFDAEFFGIRESEVGHIDPQQRLFLEVAWEALEHSGTAPAQLAGTATGVFTGLCTIDYHRLLYRDFEQIGPHSGTGTTMSITANRLSYLLDLRGPSLAVDAACSSALVAVHLACQSLRTGESERAIAGGVNLILSPDSMISSSHTGLLSQQDACRPFDADADGYVRGEGCGAVVLKRLSDAQAAGDFVWGVIRGSATNQDGRSNSLTAPNGLSQQQLVGQALQMSDVSACEIDYVEAHAVGTPLGDAIEFKALKKVLGVAREHPCYIGSVKPNIGHLEAASGIAGLIKVLLCLHYEQLPPQLNFERANAYVEPEAGSVEILPGAGQAWPRGHRRRMAGISTFGFGGTNVHLVIEEPPQETIAAWVKQPECDGGATPSEYRPHHLFTLSAKSPQALQQLAARYSRFLLDIDNRRFDQSSKHLADICFTANTGRNLFPYRLSWAGESIEILQQQLSQFSTLSFEQSAEQASLFEQDLPVRFNQLKVGHVKGRKRPKVALYFPTSAAHTVQLGEILYRTQPTFQQLLDEAVHPLHQTPESWFEQMRREPLFVETPLGHWAAVATAYSLARLWQSWGVKPHAIAFEQWSMYSAAWFTGLVSADALAEFFGQAQGKGWLAATADMQPIAIQQQLNQRFSPAKLADCEVILPLLAVSVGVVPEGEKALWLPVAQKLGALYVQGVAVDWESFDRGYVRSRLPLPTYPFERKSYWFTEERPLARVVMNSADKRSVDNRSIEHGKLNARFN